MISTIQRIKWKNITGLIVLLIIVFVIVSLVSFFNVLVYGNCVEKNSVRVCFDVKEKVIGKNEVTSVLLDVSNTGEEDTGARIRMDISPNLINETKLIQTIDSMAPGDTIKREFRISSKKELGKFKVGFDIDSDGLSDNDILITVE